MKLLIVEEESKAPVFLYYHIDLLGNLDVIYPWVRFFPEVDKKYSRREKYYYDVLIEHLQDKKLGKIMINKRITNGNTE